jgi:hypothetical protein
MRRLTEAEFIAKCKNLHGDKYDYSYVRYHNARTTVTIICRTHGPFKQVAENHLRGKGCAQCGRQSRALSPTEFVSRAHAVHGDFYNYSLVAYSRITDRVIIICPRHGSYKQRADLHLRGNGCRACVADSLRLTNDEFIQRANIIHGNKFCYDEAIYHTIDEKVRIRCPDHGIFLQSPYNHLRGQRCPECSGRREYSSWEHFLKRARQIHGDKYTYNQPPRNVKEKISITCPQHGIFQQTVDSHINGRSGCPKCAGNQKWTLDDFLSRAEDVHQGVYDYSLITNLDEGAGQNVSVVCLVHGVYKISAQAHANGKECPSCGKQARLAPVSLSADEAGQGKVSNYRTALTSIRKRKQAAALRFVEEAARIHKAKYSYERSRYINQNSKVEIICPTHGSFWQIPKNHLLGIGCYECGRLKADLARMFTTDEFIQASQRIHGNKYDYSRSRYEAARKPIMIVCPIHGEFAQTADSHMRGTGCRRCAIETSFQPYRLHLIKKNPNIARTPAFVYIMKFFSDDESFLKLGITRRVKGNRYRVTEAGYNVSLIASFPMPLLQAFLVEQDLLKRMAHLHYIPRRQFGGDSECFLLTAEAALLLELRELKSGDTQSELLESMSSERR